MDSHKAVLIYYIEFKYNARCETEAFFVELYVCYSGRQEKKL